MRQLNYLFLCIGWLVQAPLVAQTYQVPATIEWGEELREPSGTYMSKIIGTLGNNFYTLREETEGGLVKKKRTKIYIESYNQKLRLLKSRDIDLKYKNKHLDFEDVIMLGRKLYVLSSFNNQAKKKNYLFTQEISSKSLQPRRDLRMIGEIDSRSKFQEGTFDYHISRDSSKILIYNGLPYKKRQPERFALRVYDEQFEEIWSRNITLPYNDERFSVEEYRMDNEGNVYLLGIIYENASRTERRGRPTYQYIILAYSKDGEEVEEYRIDFEDKFITDLTFRVGNDRNLVCTGFYSDRGTSSVKGTYFFRINTRTKEMFNKNLKTFDFDFITEDLSERRKEKLKNAERKGDTRRQAELYQYALDDLILRSDGGALLVAEQFFVQERVQRDYFYGTFNYDYYYNYNDIIVVNIRPDGTIEWATRIPKRQVTTNDFGYFSSYAMSIVRDKIYFVYNDNSRNFENRRNNDRIFNYNGRNSIIALTELRKDGTTNTYPLFNNRDAEIITRPKICKQMGRKRMLIYGERGRKYRFASLQFD
ncbi:MAG: hypothetical protein AAFP19_13945 [Bacteroidota bacterium]